MKYFFIIMFLLNISRLMGMNGPAVMVHSAELSQSKVKSGKHLALSRCISEQALGSKDDEKDILRISLSPRSKKAMRGGSNLRTGLSASDMQSSEENGTQESANAAASPEEKSRRNTVSG